jgi:uncharacterized membrane protein (DUF2068 family)
VGDPRAPNEIGLRLIVGYKLVKAVLEVAFGAALLLFATKVTDELRSAVLHFRDHATSAWSISLADKVVREGTPRHLVVAAVASLLDGVVTSIEAWALHSGVRWGAWLVVGTTACLLPFEVLSLTRKVTAGRVTLLFVNTAIVAYLVRRESSGHTGPPRPSGHAKGDHAGGQ